MPELRVFAAAGKQFLVCSGLHKLCIVEYRDAVAEHAAGKPVRDVDRGFAFYKCVEALIDFIFRNRIQRRVGSSSTTTGAFL